jgi:hypothetical protein
VIHGLHAHDFRLEPRIVLVQVPDELKLRGRRTEDQNLSSLVEGTRDLVKEVMGVVRVRFVAFGSPRVAVNMLVRRANRGLVEPLGRNVKDARFLLIDPHGFLLKSHGSIPIIELR